jgi:hypothetical protein
VKPVIRPNAHIFTDTHYNPKARATPFSYVQNPVMFMGNKIYPTLRGQAFPVNRHNLHTMLGGEAPFTHEGSSTIQDFGLHQLSLMPQSLQEANPFRLVGRKTNRLLCSPATERFVFHHGESILKELSTLDEYKRMKIDLHHLTQRAGGALLEIRGDKHRGEWYNILHGFHRTHTDATRQDRMKRVSAALSRVNHVPAEELVQFPDFDTLEQQVKDVAEKFRYNKMDRTTHNELRPLWWQHRALDFLRHSQGQPSTLYRPAVVENRQEQLQQDGQPVWPRLLLHG